MRTLMSIFCLAAGLSAASAAAPASPEASAESPAAISIRAFTNRTSYTIGEPVQFYLMLENTSEAPQRFSANLAMDKGLEVFITPAYQRPRRFVDRVTGAILPNSISLEPGEVRGVFQHLHWSSVGDGSLAFPEPGMYRIDFAVTLTYQDGLRITETRRIAANPVSIQMFEPLTEGERQASEIMRQPEVARAVQMRNPRAESRADLERLAEVAEGTIFAEHAHFLLGLSETEGERWIAANRHLYEVYEQEDWFYPKDMVLLAILTNYHWADEPERALGVCAVLLDLYPEYWERPHPLVEVYRPLLQRREEA